MISGSISKNDMDDAIYGLQYTLDNLENNSRQALISSAVFLREWIDSEPTLVPVNTGHLRDSFTYSTPWRGGGGDSLYTEFGYPNVDYFADVHAGVVDIKGKKRPIVNWTREGSGAGWLDEAIERTAPFIEEIMQRYINVERY